MPDIATTVPTITSVELVEIINDMREEGAPELRHDNFMAKIKNHPGIASPKFLGHVQISIGNGATRKSKCYHLPKREAELMVMSESLAVQTKVYDRMTALEQQQQQVQAQQPPIMHTPLTLDMVALDMAARMLNVSESGKLGMVRHAFQHHAPHLLQALPSYAVDAPPSVLVSGNGSSMPTASATDLLKRHNSTMSTARFNQKLESCGLLARSTRQSRSSGGTKGFWTVTHEGLEFGKNLTNTKNQAETQPHWYVEKFGELVKLVDLANT